MTDFRFGCLLKYIEKAEKMTSKRITDLKTNNILRQILFILYILILIIGVVYPMKLSPFWNGEVPEHRNQYELQAESFLNGHLYLDEEVSDELKAMENPYDNVAREENKIDFRWDHAYYNEHYYMYFGVVPVFLTFLPYRIVTGKALTTYHATQLFTAGIVIAFFVLFYYLRKKFFDKMPFAVYMILTTALTLASVWYFVAAPALYCTAISAAVFLIMWSLYFFIRTAFDDLSERKRLFFCGIGALFGALTFGCRPTVALTNIILIPLFYLQLKKISDNKGKIKTIITVALPFIIIGILLALYNYVRFDNPMEFGQTYQLTRADQHEYSLFSGFNLLEVTNGFRSLFIHSYDFDTLFPYVKFNGIFFEFPIFLVGVGCAIFSTDTRKNLKENKLVGVCICIILTICLSVFVMLSMTPVIKERYKSDYIFLLSVWLFMVFGCWISGAVSTKKNRIISTVIIILSIVTAVTAILLFFIPYDANYTKLCPEVLDKIRGFFPDFTVS